jgi:PTH1 family peptidyl-tRNA hydrolase
MMVLVGLGNPGQQYARTRHNAGFLFTELVRGAYGLPAWKKQFDGLVSKGKVGGQDILLLQPQTFMNLSGRSVQATCAFYKIPPAQVWVVHDELDLALGKMKYKLGGGDAGHNGLKSITAALGANYHRLRLGIGRPTGPQPVEDYVLQNFSGTEADALEPLLEKLTKALPTFLETPIETLAKLGNAEA